MLAGVSNLNRSSADVTRERIVANGWRPVLLQPQCPLFLLVPPLSFVFFLFSPLLG
jgi:hypothetical protein